MEYHVMATGNDLNAGSREKPFRTISKAASVALPGDRVTVHAGEYREWVKPKNGGRSDTERIVYEAAEGEHVVVKGSERIQNWINMEGNVWYAKIPGSMFGDYNPFVSSLWGDWLLSPEDGSVHAGDIYLNGVSMYEAKNLEEVISPAMRTDGENPPWTKRREKIPRPEETLYQWHAEVNESETILYANFQGKDPNEELTEISVRKCCFYPERVGRNYITVRGFEMCQAASPWAPPTAEQPALLGVNWAKGWVIENNVIHDSKCCGVSIGKEYSSGDNECSRMHRKPGYQYQMEAVFRAYHTGWSKETVGSHLIQGNVIYNCGQTGIVGHLGCIFSRITENEIHNIGVKHEFFGYEIAGIKLHAAVDTVIEHNYIHDCTLGTWLDWQAQGTRVSRNLYRKNDRDLMIEVTHGPHLVDNNIFGSEYSFDNIAQGGAYVHNLFCGTMRREPVLDRSTPYHYPHSTKPLGTAMVYGGDDRWYQNIFVGGQRTYTEQSETGLQSYRECTGSLEEYIRRVQELGIGDHENFDRIRQPVYAERNWYLNGAEGCIQEKDPCEDQDSPEIRLYEMEDGIYCKIRLSDEILGHHGRLIDSGILGMPRIVEERYEQPDGTEIIFDKDINAAERKENCPSGPFAKLDENTDSILVWKFKC